MCVSQCVSVSATMYFFPTYLYGIADTMSYYTVSVPLLFKHTSFCSGILHLHSHIPQGTLTPDPETDLISVKVILFLLSMTSSRNACNVILSYEV